MLLKYYSLNFPEELKDYLEAYLPLVKNIAEKYSVDLESNQFQADHLGVQVLSSEEFDQASEMLSAYSSLIHDNIIHERRNRVYQFNDPITASNLSLPRIEIFEPKPDAELRKLKPGIEHVAFMANDYDNLLANFKSNNYPIDKENTFDDGSKFFKTSLVNLVEIEFRNDFLGVKK